MLVQEYLTGAEYSLTLVGNPDQGLRALPILEVDFSKLDPKLPKILGYEFEVGARQRLLDAGARIRRPSCRRCSSSR